MVQPGPLPLEPTCALLPEGQDQFLPFAEKNELPSLFPRLAHHVESEYLLIELLGAIKVTDVQSHMSRLKHLTQCLRGAHSLILLQRWHRFSNHLITNFDGYSLIMLTCQV